MSADSTDGSTSSKAIDEIKALHAKSHNQANGAAAEIEGKGDFSANDQRRGADKSPECCFSDHVGFYFQSTKFNFRGLGFSNQNMDRIRPGGLSDVIYWQYYT